METVRLEDICLRDHVGEYGIAAAGVDYTPQTHRYLRITDISDDGRLLDADIKGVQGDIKDKYFLKTGDIVFARTGNSTGRAYTYDERDGELVYAGFLIRYRLDPAKVNPRYLHYFTHSNYYKTWVDNLSSGSTRGNISAQTFADCPILLPSRERQDQLVSVLSALDRKIALNRKKIATLEKMAKEIYDYWFVQYDFPDAKGRPYKSSGGEMVYSPELKREIPKGWRVGCLGDVVDINKRSHNVRTLPEHINYIDISSTQCGFVGTPTVYSRDEVPGRARRIAVDGDAKHDTLLKSLQLPRHDIGVMLHGRNHDLISFLQETVAEGTCHKVH